MCIRDRFETVLNSAQNKLNQASSEIDKLVGTRTRQINRKLKNIDKLSFEDTDAYLPQEDSEDEMCIRDRLNTE